MSSSNLLKGFGEDADVTGQLATDKALRRKTTGAVIGFDITDGELIEDVPIVVGETKIPHSLARKAVGAIILKFFETPAIIAAGEIHCIGTSVSNVTIGSSRNGVASIWVA